MAAALALAVLDSVPASSPPTCDLGGKWAYLRPRAFDHTSTPAWTNQVCVYTFQPGTAAVAPPSHYRFASPPECLDDDWKATPAAIALDGDAATMTFTPDPNSTHVDVDASRPVPVVRRGFVSAGVACSRIDVEDGGVFVRASTHPFFMPNHEWLRVAAAWLVRAATIEFEDGTRHLTPGYPTANCEEQTSSCRCIHNSGQTADQQRTNSLLGPPTPGG